MKKAFAMKWADALESGKFKQAKGKLFNHKTGGYCCLGVACILDGRKFVLMGEKARVQEGGDVSEYIVKGTKDICYGILPEVVRKKIGMKTTDGTISYKDSDLINPYVGKSLTSLNDARKSFKQIAKIIRDNWKVL